MTGQRRLFLHVGTHKTGTTSIQFMLAHRRRELAGMAVHVIREHPSNTTDVRNCTVIAHAFIRQELVTPTRMRQPFGATASYGSNSIIDFFVRQFEATAIECFVLSAEAFCYLRTRTERKHLLRCLDRLGCEVTPIVYLRNESDWRASWTAQIAGYRPLPDNFTLLDDWYFNRDAIVDFWRSISPATVVHDYDKEVADRGSVIPSFLETVGLPLSLDSGQYFLNRRSVQPHGLEFRRQPQRLPGRPAK